MGRHRPILGDYPLTGRVVDFIAAASIVAIAIAMAAEMFVPGGAGKIWSNDVAIFVVSWGVLLLFIALLAKMVWHLSRRGRRLTSPAEPLELDEANLLREIHGRLSRMEDRIEALETLLLDTRRSNATRLH